MGKAATRSAILEADSSIQAGPRRRREFHKGRKRRENHADGRRRGLPAAALQATLVGRARDRLDAHCRRLCVRWEKSAGLYQSYPRLACAILLIRQGLGMASRLTLPLALIARGRKQFMAYGPSGFQASLRG